MESVQRLKKKKKYLNNYLLGFADAEGCFSIAIKHQKTAKFGLVLDPIFQVTQRKESHEILELFKEQLNCGRVIKKSGQEDTELFLVDNRRQLVEKIIPFFERYQLIAKKEDFKKFKEIVTALNNKEHSNLENFKNLIKKAYEMNLEGKQRRQSFEEIMKNLEQTRSPETICRTSKEDDIVQSLQ